MIKKKWKGERNCKVRKNDGVGEEAAEQEESAHTCSRIIWCYQLLHGYGLSMSVNA